MTGVKLSREQWVEARAAAMTPIAGAPEALRWVASRGTVSLLSNNPIIFLDCFAELAPDAAALLGSNDLVSAALGARKPERRIYTRALGSFGVEGRNAILIDDSAANLVGAASSGMHTFQLLPDPLPGQPENYNTRELMDALRAFAAR